MDGPAGKHATLAMCWRQVSKFQKTVLIVLFYYTIYLFISFAMYPDTSFTFIREELRVGNKYALLFLVAGPTHVFSDAEGADVYKSRRCGKCFITNNKGFLPLSEYDAVLVHGDRSALADAAVMEPHKRFLLETSVKCIRDKLRGCSWEPRVTSVSTSESFDLCSLCQHLLRNRNQQV